MNLEQAKLRIAELEKQRRWLFQIVDFAYDWMSSCGCVQVRNLNNPQDNAAVWHRKAGGTIKYVQDAMDREKETN